MTGFCITIFEINNLAGPETKYIIGDKTIQNIHSTRIANHRRKRRCRLSTGRSIAVSDLREMEVGVPAVTSCLPEATSEVIGLLSSSPRLVHCRRTLEQVFAAAFRSRLDTSPPPVKETIPDTATFKRHRLQTLQLGISRAFLGSPASPLPMPSTVTHATVCDHPWQVSPKHPWL